MARTTPAQNPRGEHSSTLSGGKPEKPLFSALIATTWGGSRGPVKRADLPLRKGRGDAYIPATFPVIADDIGLRPRGRPERRGDFVMQEAPLMPKATAVWLVDNTSLSFDQVADFCKMHPLEIRAIADGGAAQGIKGMDPISTGQLTRDEIEKGEKDPNYRLKLGASKVALPAQAKKKGPRYTP